MNVSPTHRSRRWFALAATGAAIVPFAARAQIKGGDDDDSRGSDDSYTSPEFGMEVTWEAPWQLDDTNERADIGYENVVLGLEGMPGDYLSLFTSLISSNFADSEEYLDHYEESYLPEKIEPLRDHTDGVHYLIHERTETSLCVMFFYQKDIGGVFELYEHHAEPDAEFATWSILMVNTSEVFEGHFTGVQQYVTLNGDAPFTTVNERDVVALATDALDGVYPDDGGSRSGRRDDDEDTDADDPVEDDDDVDAIVADLRDVYDTLEPTMDELVGLIEVELTQEQADRVNEILGWWLEAPADAAGVSLPASLGDLEDAYVAFAENLGVAGNGLIAAISEDSTEAEAQAGFDDFNAAITAHPGLAVDFDALLTEAGA